MASSRLGVCNVATPLISGTGKATDFKFGGYIYRANPNKSPLKFFKKRERGRIQGLSNFFGYSLLSQERVTLRTSNFEGTFIGWIGTKVHENVGNISRGRNKGVMKFFRAPHGALKNFISNCCLRVSEILPLLFSSMPLFL